MEILNIPNFEDSYSRIILRKLQNSKKNSKNKTIFRIKISVNTGPYVTSIVSCNLKTGVYFFRKRPNTYFWLA